MYIGRFVSGIGVGVCTLTVLSSVKILDANEQTGCFHVGASLYFRAGT